MHVFTRMCLLKVVRLVLQLFRHHLEVSASRPLVVLSIVCLHLLPSSCFLRLFTLFVCLYLSVKIVIAIAVGGKAALYKKVATTPDIGYKSSAVRRSFQVQFLQKRRKREDFSQDLIELKIELLPARPLIEATMLLCLPRPCYPNISFAFQRKQ